MTMSKTIGPLLPLLRRYARALTGSQTAGDAYVRATLEAILARKDVLDGPDPRTSLYRLFHVLWSGTTPPKSDGPDSHITQSPDKRLHALPPSNREALLLTSLEGFGRTETATILGMSEDEVEAEITAAYLEIDQQLTSRVLIIEDEPIIALHLESLMREMRHEVVGIATTRDEAVGLAFAKRPGLVLADVRLADGSSGIDAVSEILRSFDVPVIFITAYPVRLLTGERLEPTFLITKPFKPETVKTAVAQALFFHPMKQQSE